MKFQNLLYKIVILLIFVAAAGATTGCSLLFGGNEPEPEPTVDERVLVPTFTPTPMGAEASEPEAAPTLAQVEEFPTATPLPERAEPEPTAPPTPEVEEPTATPVAQLSVSINVANVRNGPGTNYGLAGSVTQGQTFDIIGKNPEGTWWLFCCVNGQETWIFDELVQTQGAETVEVAQNIPEPPPPVAVAPAQPAAPAEPPPAEPPPAEEPAQAAPPPASDPCAGIGGDGCKFRLTQGPAFGNNGGGELKLQLFFIHSGVDGGQPQGSYFVVLLKDGVRLPIADGVRSRALDQSEGALGPFNYEFKLGLGDIPGNTVAGNYTMYVLDGNGERDSQDVNFSIPEGQGEVWAVWDQG